MVSVDSNVFGWTPKLHTHDFSELAAADRVCGRFGHPVETIPELNPHSDHWPFVIHGVPAVMVSGKTEGRGRRWGHTFADTLEELEAGTSASRPSR